MPESRRGILAVLFAGVLMEALDIAMVGPALPSIREAFGVDDRAAAWVFGVFVLFNLVGTPLMAKLSDRFGRRLVYAGDVALFALGSVTVAAAPSWPVLLVGRALQGLAAGGTFPVASATIGDVYPVEKRGAALGLIGAVFGVAFLIGPIVGGILLLWSWRLLFLVSVPIAAWVAWGSLRRLPGREAADASGDAGAGSRPFDVAGMVTLALILGGVAYALNRIDSGDLGASVARPEVWGVLLGATLLLAVLHVVEHRAADPILPPRLVRSRQILLAGALSAGAGLAEAGFIFMPAMLVAALGVTSSNAAFMLLPLVVAMGIGAPVGGRTLDRVGPRAVSFSAAVLVAVGAGIVAIFETDVGRFYTGSVLIGLGLGALLGSVLRYVMLNEAPEAHRGAAQGLVTIFLSIGQLIGSATLGAIIASGGFLRGDDHGGATSPLVGGYPAAFDLIAIVMLVLALASLALRRSYR